MQCAVSSAEPVGSPGYWRPFEKASPIGVVSPSSWGCRLFELVTTQTFEVRPTRSAVSVATKPATAVKRETAAVSALELSALAKRVRTA